MRQVRYAEIAVVQRLRLESHEGRMFKCQAYIVADQIFNSFIFFPLVILVQCNGSLVRWYLLRIQGFRVQDKAFRNPSLSEGTAEVM